MSAGFDRSLLEGKDRDELIQIATALGEKPLSRAKKADIIALVLRAAGVEDDGPAPAAAPKAKRAPRAKPNAKTAAGVDGATKDSAQLPLDAAENLHSGTESSETAAAEPTAAAAAEAPVSAGSDGADRADASSKDPASAGSADVAERGSEQGGRDQGNGQSQGQDGGSGSGRSQGQADSDQGRNGPVDGTRPDSQDSRQGRNGGRDEQSQGSRENQGNRQSQGGQAQGGGGGSPQNQGSQGNDQQSGQRPGGDRQGQGSQQRGNQSQGNQGNGPSSSGQGGNQNQGNHGNQNQGGQNQGNQQGAGIDPNQQAGGQGPNGESESANKRRRRRGRDRDRQNGPQGQGQGPDEAFVGEPVPVAGLLDLRDEGYGFLRLKGYLPSSDDVYVSVKQARQFNLRKGDLVTGTGRPAARNEKNPALHSVETVNGVEPERARQRPRFEDLTPLFPDEKLRLEMADDATNMTTRIIDLIAPIGKGQRGLIVSPPKAGKTTVMKHIARSIEVNHPDVELIVLLVDERPEEVTDMKRWLKRGEVAASTFDRPSEEHTHVSELVIERAKRMVEEGKDVVIILDGITRLARAYNLAQPPSGRIMSGGIDAAALYPPKKFFGAARNVEEGGSLTILATALVETNSRMDEHIFEEFKGTGNMELKLDRRLADRRIYPAIDVEASSTRREELLFDRRQLQNVWKLRRVLSGLSSDGGSSAAGLELLIDRMRTFKSNEAFLTEIGKAGTGM